MASGEKYRKVMEENRADRVTWMDLETVMLSEVHQTKTNA